MAAAPSPAYGCAALRPTAQQARAALLVSLCMTLLGTCGVGNGLATVNQTSLPAPPQIVDGAGADADLVLVAQASPLAEALFEGPLRRPLAVANALASAMLLIGSFLLTFRRPATLWWIRNAIAANVLYIAAAFGHIAYCLLRDMSGLSAALEAYGARYARFEIGAGSEALILQALAVGGVAALLSIGLHVALGVRCHRPDIRAFLDSGA
jgi:hypothetical protein